MKAARRDVTFPVTLDTRWWYDPQDQVSPGTADRTARWKKPARSVSAGCAADAVGADGICAGSVEARLGYGVCGRIRDYGSVFALADLGDGRSRVADGRVGAESLRTRGGVADAAGADVSSSGGEGRGGAEGQSALAAAAR